MACDYTDCPECRKAAERRARRLLHSHLTDAQIRHLRFHHHITVRGSATGDEYQIRYDGWVTRLRDNAGFCLNLIDNFYDEPEVVYVPSDMILAKKILLETNEDLFLEVANETEP